jgi:2-phospho-L-lactate guanylyltransferase
LTDAVLVPVKRFRQAKLRLRPVFDEPTRMRVARLMAERVIAAASGLPVAVVCDDDDVAAWAETLGVEIIWAPGRGLNGAVADGVGTLARSGAERVIVSHADLPLALDLRPLGGFDGVTLVPDRRRDGTNVLAVPATAGFDFAYGPKSFLRHRAEAERLGLATRVVDDERLAWDVDVPADLDFPDGLADEVGELFAVPCR